MKNVTNRFVWAGVGMFAIIVATALVGLIVAKAARFNDTRQSIAEWYSGQLLGQRIRVSGEVNVSLWPNLEFALDETTGRAGDGTLLHLNNLTLTLESYWRLIFGLSFKKIDLRAGRVLTTTGAPVTPPDGSGAALAKLILGTPTVSVSNFRLAHRDPVNGWDVDIGIEQLRGAASTDNRRQRFDGVVSIGGKRVRISANIERQASNLPGADGAYVGNASLSGEQLKAEIRGSASTATFDRDLDLRIDVSTFRLGDVFDALGLKYATKGAGTLRAHLAGHFHQIALRSGRLNLTLSSGHQIEISGSVKSLWTGTGINLDVSAAAESTTSPSPPSNLNDIRFTKASGKVQGDVHSVQLRDFSLQTNLFDRTFAEIGPIGVKSISRTPQGLLALRGIELQAGPAERPWLRVAGSVGDAIQFGGVDLKGEIDIPLDFVFDVDGGLADTLGRLAGKVAVTERDGALTVTALDVQVAGSRIWSMKLARATSKQPERSETAFSASVAVSSFSRLAKLFGLTAKFSGPISFDGRLLLSGNPKFEGKIGVGRTRFDVALAGVTREGRSAIDGELSSATVYADELYAVALTKGTGEDTKLKKRTLPKQGSFNVNPLTLFDSDVQIKADKLHGGGDSASGIETRIKLTKGRLSADPIAVRYAGGRIRGIALLDATKQPTVVRIKGSAAGWNLASLVNPKDAGFAASGRLSAYFDLGTNWTALTQSATPWSGRLTLNVRQGRLGTSILDFAGLGFWRGLFSAPSMKGETALRCVRAPLSISGASIRTAPVIELETDHVRIVGHGSMNFHREHVNLYFEPRPLDDLTGHSPYPFVIKGKLANPAVEVTDARNRTPARRYAVRSCQPKRQRMLTACSRSAAKQARGKATLFGWSSNNSNPPAAFGAVGHLESDGDFRSVARGARSAALRARLYKEALRSCLAKRTG